MDAEPFESVEKGADVWLLEGDAVSTSAPFKDDEDEGIVRFDREENSSWLPNCCCAPCEGEKGDEEDETDVARLRL